MIGTLNKEYAIMRVLRLHEPFDMRFHDEPAPEVGRGEVLLRVGSVGVCASDVHYYREGRIGDQVVESPLILGHEFSGTVVKVGEGVRAIAEGARVAVEPGRPCGECAQCGEGYHNLCRNVVFFGTPPVDGALREYLAWPAELCIQVSEQVTLDEAAMIEPLAVGVYAVDLAEMAGGESVAILGAGAIGLSVLQAARIVGPGRIIVTDPVSERRELALRLGADIALDPAATDSTAIIMEQTGGGAEVVFECAGMPESTWQTVQVVRPKGRVVVVGIPEEDRYCFGGSLSRRREVNVQFVRRSRNTGERSVEMLERKLVDVASFATHRFPFDQADAAFRLAMAKADGVVRAVIQVSPDTARED